MLNYEQLYKELYKTPRGSPKCYLFSTVRQARRLTKDGKEVKEMTQADLILALNAIAWS